MLESGFNQNSAPGIAETFLEAISDLIQIATYNIIPIHENICPNNWIGCYDDDSAYLLPTIAFTAAKKHCKQQNVIFPASSKEVWADLEKNGIANYDTQRKRYSKPKKLPCRGNKNVDVLIIPRDKINGL